MFAALHRDATICTPTSSYFLRGRLRNPGTNIREDLFQCHRGARHVRCVAAKVALLSSRDNSPNLVPVIIVGGAQGSASDEFLDNLAWFREHGGIVYHHNLTFGADLQVCLGTHSARFYYTYCTYSVSQSQTLDWGFTPAFCCDTASRVHWTSCIYKAAWLRHVHCANLPCCPKQPLCCTSGYQVMDVWLTSAAISLELSKFCDA